MDYTKTVFGLVELMRPLEWTKSFGNMLIASLTAAMVFGVKADFGLFFSGFASLALLWSGLYALNDYTDRKADALHPVKKERAIPSGRVQENLALLFSLVLIALSLVVAVSLNQLIVLCWIAMFVNQFFYTMKPFNFKKKPVLDLVSGSLVNPIFRFYYGWVLFVPAFNAPIQVLLFILGIQFGGYGLYRLMSKSFEKKIGAESSVVLFGEKNIKALFYVSLVLGVVFYFVSVFTVWKPGYAVLGLLMIVFLPQYRLALKNPEKEDMKKMYRLVYYTYIVFLAGFIALFFFFQ